jgi:predicted nuclease with TOPRIM domain
MAFKGYKRSITLEFDYNEVKEGIPNVKKQMAVLNAEFKKSSEEAKASGKEIDNLGVKYDYLSNKLKIQEKEVDNYRQQLEKAQSAQGNNAKAVQNATTSLEIAEAKLGQTRAQLEQVTKELEKNKTILGKTSEEWKRLGDKTTELGKNMSLKLTAPILAAGAASFKLGADYEQALGKMEVVFEKNSKEIESWAQNALRDFGLARKNAITMASDFGALFKGMGFSIEQTKEWSKTLTERTMDLSNFYDTSVDETINALNAIVTGQTEPLRKFGINMTQATLQEHAYANGIRKKVANMTEAEKVQLRYNYVIEKTNIAVGTTARESDSATGQLNQLNQSVTELGTSFSEHVLPVVTPFIKGLNKMVQGFAGLSDGTKKFIVTVAGIAAVVGPVLIVLGSVFKAISNITQSISSVSKIIKGVGDVGATFSGTLNSTGFFGFAKWALIIAVVAASIGYLIKQLNILLGKGKETQTSMTAEIQAMTGTVNSAMSGTARRGYAVGTRYHTGGQALVGEEGPEVIDIPKGTRVHTAQETKKMLQGGGDTFIIQVNMDEVDEVSKLVKVVNDLKRTKRAGFAHG